MKKIVIALVLLCAMQMNAQDRDQQRLNKTENREKGQRQAMKDLSAEQIAELKTKKMTLALDLSETQQKQMLALNTRIASDKKQKMKARELAKESNKKLTSDEKFEMMNARLDAQIAYKNDIKQILDATQYEKWEKMQSRKGKRKHKEKGKKK